MAKTLGERLDELQESIETTQKSQAYQTGDNQLTRASLSSLYLQEERLLSKIAIYGRNYIEGSNTEPMGKVSFVSFV